MSAEDNMTLLIDPETHDLVLDDDGIVKTIYGDQTTAQSVRLTLEVYKGEFPLDLSHGTDYERIMGKKPHQLEQDEAEEVIREGIFQEEGVKELETLTVKMDGRTARTEFSGFLHSGTRVSTEVTAG